MASDAFNQIVNATDHTTLITDSVLQGIIKRAMQGSFGEFEFSVKGAPNAATATTIRLQLTDTANLLVNTNNLTQTRFTVEYVDNRTLGSEFRFLWIQKQATDAGDGSVSIALDSTVDFSYRSIVIGGGAGQFSFINAVTTQIANTAGTTLDAGFRILRNDNVAVTSAAVLQTISIRNATVRWILSGSGTSEYYVEKAAGGDPEFDEPDSVLANAITLTKGTLGSLSASEHAFGNNDSLTFTTIYTRLADSTDPDSKAVDFVKAVIPRIVVPRWVNPLEAPHNAVGDGINDDNIELLSADTAAGVNGSTYIEAGKTYHIAAEAANPTYVSNFIFDNGGLVDVNAGVTVTFNGPITAAPHQKLFTGAGTVNFGGKVTRSPVKWFGAVGDGVADDSTAVLNASDALSSAGGIVYSPTGTYLLSAPITIGATLKGLEFEPGAILKWTDDANTPTIGGPIIAERWRIFDGSDAPLPLSTYPFLDVLPEWFGAVGGNAAVNDTAPFQQAVDFAAGTGGGDDRRRTIRLIANLRYYVVGLDLSDKPVKIVGSGLASSGFIQFADTDHVIKINMTTATTGIVFEDFSVDGDSSTTFDGVFAQRIELFEFHRMLFQKARYGLHLDNLCRFGVILSSVFGSGNTYGLFLDTSAQDNRVINNWFNENDDRGMSLGASSRNLITSNSFSDNTNLHIFCDGADNTIMNNSFKGGSGGFVTATAVEIDESRNIVAYNSFDTSHTSTEIKITAGTDGIVVHNWPLANVAITDAGINSAIFKHPASGNSILVAENTIQTLLNKTLTAPTITTPTITGPTTHTGIFHSEFGGIGKLENLTPYSEEMERWTQGSQANVTANFAASPTGEITADRIQRPAGEDNAFINNTITVGTVDARTFTVSFSVKDNSGSSGALRVRLTTVGADEEVIASNPAITTSWQRVSVTGTVSGGNTDTQIIIWLNSTTASIVDVLCTKVQLTESSSIQAYVRTGNTPISTALYGYAPNTILSPQILSTMPILDLAGANATFTTYDGHIHEVDPNGSVNYNPSGPFPRGYQLTVINTAGAAETITFDSAVLNQAITQNQRGIFAYNGTVWRKIFVG